MITIDLSPILPLFTPVCREQGPWLRATEKFKRQFAKERGWSYPCQGFSLEMLAEGRTNRAARDWGGHSGGGGIDHPEYFRKARRPVALATHVYAKDCTACYALAAEYGLIFVPLSLSWYYPMDPATVGSNNPSGAWAGLYMRQEDAPK